MYIYIYIYYIYIYICLNHMQALESLRILTSLQAADSSCKACTQLGLCQELAGGLDTTRLACSRKSLPFEGDFCWGFYQITLHNGRMFRPHRSAGSTHHLIIRPTGW